MAVNMDVKHCGPILQGNLQRLPNRCRSHHRSHAGVLEVIFVGDWLIIVGEDYPTCGVQGSYLTGQESDSFSGKRVRSAEVLANSTKQTCRNLETYPHLNALMCCASISAGRWLAGTLFQDQVCHVRLRIV